MTHQKRLDAIEDFLADFFRPSELDETIDWLQNLVDEQTDEQSNEPANQSISNQVFSIQLSRSPISNNQALALLKTARDRIG